MKRLRFHAAVADEVERTARWYEEERVGLGGEFLAALDQVLARFEGDEIATSRSPKTHVRVRVACSFRVSRTPSLWWRLAASTSLSPWRT